MGPNGRRIVAALTATKFGDRIVDVKTVLASLLPCVRAEGRRKPLWLLGAAGQAAAVAAIAIAALTLTGTAAGIVLGRTARRGRPGPGRPRQRRRGVTPGVPAHGSMV